MNDQRIKMYDCKKKTGNFLTETPVYQCVRL